MPYSPTEETNPTEINENLTVKTRWGFYSTLALGLIAIVVFIITQVLAAIVLASHYNIPLEELDTLPEVLGSGFIAEVTFPVGALFAILTVILFIKLRKGFSIREYLCINIPTARTLLTWVGILLLLILAQDVTSYLLGKDIVPQESIDTYLSSKYAFLLFLTVLVLAPISEEVIFRGFMLMGMKPKEGCPVWVVLFISFIWTILHVQYDLYYMSLVFISGILLGVAQVRTNSIVVPITLHFLCNLIATIELLIVVHYLS